MCITVMGQFIRCEGWTWIFVTTISGFQCFWSPPEDDLDDHHEFSLVKLLSFRPIGLSLALGYLFQDSPHDLSPFRTSVARQRCMRCGRIGFWRFGLGPWNHWPTAVAKKREVETYASMMPMKNDASKCSQQTLTPISVEYWVMTLHTKLVPSGFVTIQKSQTLTSCEKNCGIPPSGNFIQENLWSTINFLGTLFQFQTSPGILLMLFNSIQGLEVVVVYHFHQRKQAIYQSAGSANTKQNLRSVNLSMKQIHENWEIHWKYVDFQNVKTQD